MKAVTIYGFRCSRKDEKILAERVNEYLATHRRTTTRARSQSMLSAYFPLIIKHFYWNLNKEMGTWFDIYPNEDINGQYFFPDRMECGWLMHLRLDLKRHAKVVKEKSEAFAAGLLQAMRFEHTVMAESDDLLAGLPRGVVNRNLAP